MVTVFDSMELVAVFVVVGAPPRGSNLKTKTTAPIRKTEVMKVIR